eukprot:661440_1
MDECTLDNCCQDTELNTKYRPHLPKHRLHHPKHQLRTFCNANHNNKERDVSPPSPSSKSSSQYANAQQAFTPSPGLRIHAGMIHNFMINPMAIHKQYTNYFIFN